MDALTLTLYRFPRVRGSENGGNLMSLINPSELGLTVSRKGTMPIGIDALVKALREATRDWDRLAGEERANGGKIAAVAKRAATYASALVETHGADGEAVKVAVATREILNGDVTDAMALIGLAENGEDAEAA